MMFIRTMFIGAAILASATGVANAQWQYPTPPQFAANPYEQTSQPYPSYRDNQAFQPHLNGYVPATPPSWSFDPYTNGLSPSPNRSNGS
jgi:hypothetical protein